MADANNTDASVSTFISSAIFTVAVSAILFLVFAIVRPRFPRVYSPKTYMGPERERPGGTVSGILGWVFGGRKLREQDLIDRCGLDAYMFLDFLNKSFFLFMVFALLAIPILIPLNTVDQLSLVGLNQFTIANVADQPRLWGHLILTVLFCVVTLVLCIWSIRTYISRRQRYLTSDHHAQSLQATTVLVCGIPPGADNIQSLNSIFGTLPGGVRRIWLAYEAAQLQKDCTKRMALTNKLETAECNLIRAKLKLHNKGESSSNRRQSQASVNSTDLLANNTNGAGAGADGTGAALQPQSDESFPPQKRPMHRLSPFPLSKLPCGGEKIDSIISFRSELSNMNASILARQQAAMAAMHENQDVGKMSSAFIQFSHQLGAHLAAQSVVHTKTLTMSPRYLEVHPNDVLWDNLGYSLKNRNVRRVIAIVLAFFLIALWTIPVTFVASIAKLDAIVQFAPFLSGVYDLPNVVVGIIQGILPPIGLAILMMILPIILYKLAHFGGAVLHTGKTLEVVTSFHWFSVVHVLLVTTLANGIFAAVEQIKENPTKIMEMLASTLPQASTFFLSFILLSFIQIPLLLLQIGPLIMYHVGKFLSSTPRQMFVTERTMGSVDWGMTIPRHTIAFSIGLLYSTIQPLILPLMVIYFGLFYLAFRYQFLYVYRQPFDSGGLIYPRIVDQIYVAVILFEIVMMGLFVLQKAIGQSVIMFILLCGSIAAIVISRDRVFKPLIEYLPIEIFDSHGVANAGLRALENGTGVDTSVQGASGRSRGPLTIVTKGHNMQRPAAIDSSADINPVPAQEIFHEKAPYKDPHSPLQESNEKALPVSHEIYSPDVLGRSPTGSSFLGRHSRQNSILSQRHNSHDHRHEVDPSSTNTDGRSHSSNPSPLPRIRVESLPPDTDGASNVSLAGSPKTSGTTTTASATNAHQNRLPNYGSQPSDHAASSIETPKETITSTSHYQQPVHAQKISQSPRSAIPRQVTEYDSSGGGHRGHGGGTGSLQVLGASQSLLSASNPAAEKIVPDSLAYVNPALWTSPQPVWLPQDPRGFAEIEKMELTNAGLANTTESATMNQKGQIEVDVRRRDVAPGDVLWE